MLFQIVTHKDIEQLQLDIQKQMDHNESASIDNRKKSSLVAKNKNQPGRASMP